MRTHRFSDQLHITFSNKASAILRNRYWVVTTEFTYRITEDGGEVVHIPQGYLTDGACITKLLQKLIPIWGQQAQACVVHDYLCEYLQICKDGKTVRIDRARCDKILNEALKEAGVSSVVKRTIYKSVCFYRHFAAAINPSFSLEKRDLERSILANFEKTGNWS